MIGINVPLNLIMYFIIRHMGNVKWMCGDFDVL